MTLHRLIHGSRLPVLGLAAWLSLWLTPAAAVEPVQLYQRARQTGMAEGELTGPLMTRWREITGSRAPVKIKASALRSVEPVGCVRLDVVASQPNSKEDQEPIRLEWQVDACPEGVEPMSSRRNSIHDARVIANGTPEKPRSHGQPTAAQEALQRLSQIDPPAFGRAVRAGQSIGNRYGYDDLKK